ncbi:LysM peptidoglycan-binding domain-containing protein [Bacillus sp. 1P06AnD]|uniref:M23 family metallopeptidase n=1 Tax=Bacillus sp. 1P06AnD TaxID=3132208 RepID=UPI0039A15821
MMSKNKKVLAIACTMSAFCLAQPIAEASQSTYQIKQGDTLTSIGNKFHVSVQDLKNWNQLQSDMIFINQSLKVGGKAQTVPSQSTVSTGSYIVKKGDTLSAIAIAYKTTVSQLKQLNHLQSDTILIGQKLHISGEAAQPTVNESTSIQTNSDMQSLNSGMFPLKKGSYQPYGDSWGNSRTFKGDRHHEGIDIMAPKGTPIFSATGGKIIRYGWNTLGGWQISVLTNDGMILYYAHMSKYAYGLANGSTVKQGQIIGYVGNSGYGKEGTTGMFDPHLHVGLYNTSWVAQNPYQLLKNWENGR